MTHVNRRNFLKLGALFVPVVAAPTVVYSFLWARTRNIADTWAESLYGLQRYIGETDSDLMNRCALQWLRPLAAALQVPEHTLLGGEPWSAERFARFEAGAPKLWPAPPPLPTTGTRVE